MFVGGGQKGVKCRRRGVLLIALVLTIVHAEKAQAQSLNPARIAKSSRIDLKGLTKDANSGSTAAQFQLAVAYQFGKGVDQDIYEAIRWYRMAANGGDPNAQNNLGYLYQTGPKGVKDLAEAAKWYMRAATVGNALSQLHLGLLYVLV